MVRTVNNYAEADTATQKALALIDGDPPIQPPPPPPPSTIIAAAPPPPVIVAAVAPPPPVIEEVLAPSDSVIDALYADFSTDSEEIDFSLEELDSAMQEMEEEYSRKNKLITPSCPEGCSSPLGQRWMKTSPGKLRLRRWIRGRDHLLLPTMLVQRSCLLRLIQCNSRRNSAPVRATTTTPQTCHLQHPRRQQPILPQL